MYGNFEDGSAAVRFAGFASVVLMLLWGCSPVDLTDDMGMRSDSVDAAVTSAGEFSSGAQLGRTTEGRPQMPGPAPTTVAAVSSGPHSNGPASDTGPGETEPGSAPLTDVATPSGATSQPLTSSAEPDSTSEAIEPPIDPECLATAVESMPSGLAGFAKVSGYDVAQTVGGSAGEVVYVGTERALRNELQSSAPRVVVVCGEIVLTERLPISSNKTLLGLGPSSILRGGIDIRGAEGGYVSNVIVANLTVDPSALSPDDYATDYRTGIRVEYAHHVWLDHLDVHDAPWGLVDVVWGSDLVTLSWNKFYFTPDAPDWVHRFGVRVGDVNDGSVVARDGGKLRVTLHHNWFGEAIDQRIPRVAYGDVHIVNNYYSTTNNDNTIRALSEHAAVLVQSNYFERTHSPHEIPPTIEVQNDELAQIEASGNVYYGTTGERHTRGTAFNPPYELSRDSTVWLPSLVPWGAGPHLSFQPAPPWSDAGAVAPSAETSADAGVSSTSEGASVTVTDETLVGTSESDGDAPDASEPGSGPVADASLGAVSTE